MKKIKVGYVIVYYCLLILLAMYDTYSSFNMSNDAKFCVFMVLIIIPLIAFYNKLDFDNLF